MANAALTILALAVAFAFCELAVRLAFKDRILLFPRYHTDYQYGRYTIRGIRPNAEFWHTSVDGSWKFVTNSKGLRNTREFPYAKPAGTLRVLSLGDSHTQGYEVRQDFTFSAVVERYLNRHGINAESINAGVSGFSTAEALVFLENEGYRYSPDVVVLGFFANDFEDNLKAGLFGLDAQDRLTEEKYEHIPGVRIQNALYSLPPVRWLSGNSYFYSLLFNTVWEYFKARLAARAAQRADANAGSAAAATEVFEYAVPTATALTDRQITLAAALIERMHWFSANRGIRFVVVDVPTRTGSRQFSSSLPPPLLERLKAGGVEYVSSERLLADFDGAGEIHVPRGHDHISELTHTLIGVEIGRRLLVTQTHARD